MGPLAVTVSHPTPHEKMLHSLTALAGETQAGNFDSGLPSSQTLQPYKHH